MLELESLPPDALRQVYEWDNGAAFESFETYATRLSRPNWTHYAILDDGRFIGSISLELTGPTTCSIHVAKTPGVGLLKDLRRLIFTVADILFCGGMKHLVAEIFAENRAARLLAVACGMFPAEKTATHHYFRLTAEQYFNSWMKESLYEQAESATASV